MLQIRLLGEFAVERDGEPVVLPEAVGRLLALLAVRPGPHHRDALAATFWPDIAAPTARARLRSSVWALRKAIGHDSVAGSKSVVGLQPDGVWVDLAEVSTRIGRGELDEAIALCRGELLPGLADDWAGEARLAQHAAQADLLDRLAEQAERRGDGSAAVRWSRQRCALDPLDEAAQAALLRRMAADGDRAGGLIAARDFVRRLHGELGMAPGPAVRAAMADLRGPATQGSAADGSGPSRAPAGLPRRLYPMFGRSAELSALMAAWTVARDGRGRVMLLTGEGGIGKTRLITEVARRVAGSGARVAVGAGLDAAGEAPLVVWQELARELVGTVPPPPAAHGWPAELGRLAPDLAAALGRSGIPAPVAAPELERLRIFDATLRLVEWAAADRPVLLVAEDLHRSDRASLALCTHIGRRLAGLPVLMLLTRRDRPSRPEADLLIADLAGRGVAVGEIELGPLADAELAAVTRSVAALDDDDVQRVVSAADGNPLLAVERARALAAGGTSLPASLRVAVRAVLGPLPDSARELAEGLAAAGRALTAAEIDALGLADRELAESLVLETGLVRRDGAVLGFRHALLAEAARMDLRDPQRRHQAVAMAVEGAAGPAADRMAAEVARHLQRAGRDDLAGPRWRRAARHARSLGALPEAVSFWAEAVRCAPEDPEPRLELAEVYAWLGRRDDFDREWEAAIALVPSPEMAAAWNRRGNVLRSVLCHPSAALLAYQRAMDLLPPDAPVRLRAEVMIGLAQVQIGAERDRTPALLAAAARLVPDPDPDLIVDTEAARLLWLIGSGRFDLEDAAERGAAAMERVDRPDQAFAGLVTAACGLAAGGDLPAGLRMADRALALTRSAPVLTLPCLAARAHLLSRLGRHAEARAAAAEQLAMAERLDSPTLAALARNDAGLVALAAGRHAEAAELLGAALDGDARISRPASRLARAEALAGAGDAEQAGAELRRAVLEPVGPGDQPWALVPRMARVQGLVALAGGDRELARRRFAEAIAGWQARRRPDAGDELMASLVDLGRPPVVGLVDPAWELARLRSETATLEEAV